MIVRARGVRAVFVITSLLVGVGMGLHWWLMLALMVAAQLTFYAVHWQCYCVGAIHFHRSASHRPTAP